MPRMATAKYDPSHIQKDDPNFPQNLNAVNSVSFSVATSRPIILS